MQLILVCDWKFRPLKYLCTSLWKKLIMILSNEQCWKVICGSTIVQYKWDDCTLDFHFMLLYTTLPLHYISEGNIVLHYIYLTTLVRLWHEFKFFGEKKYFNLFLESPFEQYTHVRTKKKYMQRIHFYSNKHQIDLIYTYIIEKPNVCLWAYVCAWEGVMMSPV